MASETPEERKARRARQSSEREAKAKEAAEQEAAKAARTPEQVAADEASAKEAERERKRKEEAARKASGKPVTKSAKRVERARVLAEIYNDKYSDDAKARAREKATARVEGPGEASVPLPVRQAARRRVMFRRHGTQVMGPSEGAPGVDYRKINTPNVRTGTPLVITGNVDESGRPISTTVEGQLRRRRYLLGGTGLTRGKREGRIAQEMTAEEIAMSTNEVLESQMTRVPGTGGLQQSKVWRSRDERNSPLREVYNRDLKRWERVSTHPRTRGTVIQYQHNPPVMDFTPTGAKAVPDPVIKELTPTGNFETKQIPNDPFLLARSAEIANAKEAREKKESQTGAGSENVITVKGGKGKGKVKKFIDPAVFTARQKRLEQIAKESNELLGSLQKAESDTLTRENFPASTDLSPEYDDPANIEEKSLSSTSVNYDPTETDPGRIGVKASAKDLEARKEAAKAKRAAKRATQRKARALERQSIPKQATAAAAASEKPETVELKIPIWKEDEERANRLAARRSEEGARKMAYLQRYKGVDEAIASGATQRRLDAARFAELTSPAMRRRLRGVLTPKEQEAEGIKPTPLTSTYEGSGKVASLTPPTPVREVSVAGGIPDSGAPKVDEAERSLIQKVGEALAQQTTPVVFSMGLTPNIPRRSTAFGTAAAAKHDEALDRRINPTRYPATRSITTTTPSPAPTGPFMDTREVPLEKRTGPEAAAEGAALRRSVTDPAILAANRARADALRTPGHPGAGPRAGYRTEYNPKTGVTRRYGPDGKEIK